MRYRIIAIGDELAADVRRTGLAPGYGHPASVDVARGYGPCRLCLATFTVGVDRRILFTLDPFAGREPLPLPGPVFIHEAACARYREDAGFPDGLRPYALTLEGWARGRKLVAQAYVSDGNVEPALERLFAGGAVQYVHVRNTRAGCYAFTVESGEA